MAGTPETKQKRATNGIEQRRKGVFERKKRKEGWRKNRGEILFSPRCFSSEGLQYSRGIAWIFHRRTYEETGTVPRVMFHGRERTTGSPLVCILVGVVARPVPRSRVNSDRAAEQRPGASLYSQQPLDS